MDSCSDKIVRVIDLRKFKTDKKYKEEIVKEILAAICAMLNSNGGIVIVHFNKGFVPVEDSSQLNTHPDFSAVDSFPQMSVVVRILDQSMMAIIGIEETRSKIYFKEDKECITVSVKRADSLITTNYNLHASSQTQVVEVSPLKPPKEIKDNVINRKIVLEPIQLGTHCDTFFKDKKCDFFESTKCQFKNPKAEQSKRTTLADRMTGKGNKFSCYVSAFANYSGGNIYYGITDDRVVEGEFIPNEKDKKNITKQIKKAIDKMVWPEQIGQPKRGEHWEIFFEPVLDENSESIPSTFVVVIYIAPCLGGVFTEEPEYYEMEEGKVKKMPFDTWKKKILQLISWSSDASRKAFTVRSETLRKGISNANWESVRNECNSLQNESSVTHCNNLRKTMKLVILFKRVTASNRTGKFSNARKSLEEYKALFPNVQDSFIFEVLGLYLEAALQRAIGNFELLKVLLTEALSKAEHIEPGLVTATVYIFAATVSDLINLESPAVLTVRALEHLKCVRDSSDVVADMKRRGNMILATYHLGVNISGRLIEDRIDISSLKYAKNNIKAIYKSAYKEHPQSVYFDVQLNLVLSIFKYRHSQLYPDQRIRDLHDGDRYAMKAQNLAGKYGFMEMVRWSKNNQALCAHAETSVIQNHGKNDRPCSTSRPGDRTQNAESQVMSAKSQNSNDPNVETSSQIVRPLKCIPDSSDNVADMTREKNINSATFHLGCDVSGQLIKESIDISSLKKAKSCVKAIYKSAYKEHPWSEDFDVQLNFVFLIFKYRHSQLYPDERTRDLRHGRGYAKKTQKLAVEYGFKGKMFELSADYEKLCDQELKRSETPVPSHENDGRPRSMALSRDMTEKTESQVKPDNEETLLCAAMKPMSDTDSSDKQAQPQRNSVSATGRQIQPDRPPRQSEMSKHVDAEPFYPRASSPSRTASHHILPNVSTVPTQPETSAYEMPMHVPGASGCQGIVSCRRHIGTSPNESHAGFSNFGSSFNRLPVGLFQAQGPVQQIQPSNYLPEFSYRAQSPNHPAAAYGAYQPGLRVNLPGPMMTIACSGDARVPYVMSGPIQTYLYHRFPIQQLPVSQLHQQQQEMFGNPPRRQTFESRRQHRYWR